MGDSIWCHRCRVTFPIAYPNRAEGVAGAPEFTRCAERGCDTRFWHGSNRNFATVGISPDDLPRRRPSLEEVLNIVRGVTHDAATAQRRGGV